MCVNMSSVTTIFVLILSVTALNLSPCFAGRFLRPYKLMKNQPHVTLYENENFRGNIHNQVIGKECVNIPDKYSNWASSFESHRRCVQICELQNCVGKCAKLEPNTGMVPRLQKIGFNDLISSVKSCYS